MSLTSMCNYTPGQIVHHKKYGYRGVIYDVDEVCKANDDWYLANKTQPNRKQPWYHVLVDGGSNTTYVAEENLERDQDQGPIHHPLIDEFFSGFDKGKYFRDYNA